MRTIELVIHHVYNGLRIVTLYGGMAVNAVAQVWCIVMMLVVCAPPALAGSEFVRAKTVFQTNVHYDPRVAIAVDAVIVHLSLIHI